MIFRIGTVMCWKHNEKPAYEKLDDDWWVSLDSYYVSNAEQVDKGAEPIVRPESEKPLYRNGKLNRFGFKLPDEQVHSYYKNIMYFVT